MDKYTIIKSIGEGAMAQTYLAKQNKTGNQVVLKRLPLGAFSTNEMHLVQKVKHPNIIPCLETFTHEGAIYLVFMYAEGGDLDALLKMSRGKTAKPGAVDPHLKTLLTWFLHCCKACQYCHENRVMHRDIKLANILLSKDKQVAYLGDFGVGKDFGSVGSGGGQSTTTLVGSPAGYSPEVMSGIPYSYMSDVWSLGCVLYELMCQKHPFEADSFAQLVTKVCGGNFAAIPKNVPKEVETVIRGMLNVDTNERLQLPEVTMAIRNFLKSITVSERSGNFDSQSNFDVSPRKVKASAVPQNLSPGSFRTDVSVPDVDEGDDDGQTEESLESWIKAKYHQMRSIDHYLESFRAEDRKRLGAPHNSKGAAERPSTSDMNAQRAQRMLESPAKSGLPEPPPAVVKKALATPAAGPSKNPAGGGPIGAKPNSAPRVLQPVSGAARNVAGAARGSPVPRSATPPTPMKQDPENHQHQHRRTLSDSDHQMQLQQQKQQAAKDAADQVRKEQREKLKQQMEQGRAKLQSGGNDGGGDVVLMAKATPPVRKKSTGLTLVRHDAPVSGPVSPPPQKQALGQRAEPTAGGNNNMKNNKNKLEFVSPAQAQVVAKGGGAKESSPTGGKDKDAQRDNLRAMIKEQRAKKDGSGSGGDVEILLPANLRKLPQNQL